MAVGWGYARGGRNRLARRLIEAESAASEGGWRRGLDRHLIEDYAGGWATVSDIHGRETKRYGREWADGRAYDTRDMGL